jgi:hypothetical protein
LWGAFKRTANLLNGGSKKVINLFGIRRDKCPALDNQWSAYCGYPGTTIQGREM